MERLKHSLGNVNQTRREILAYKTNGDRISKRRGSPTCAEPTVYDDVDGTCWCPTKDCPEARKTFLAIKANSWL